VDTINGMEFDLEPVLRVRCKNGILLKLFGKYTMGSRKCIINKIRLKCRCEIKSYYGTIKKLF